MRGSIVAAWHHGNMDNKSIDGTAMASTRDNGMANGFSMAAAPLCVLRCAAAALTISCTSPRTLAHLFASPRSLRIFYASLASLCNARYMDGYVDGFDGRGFLRMCAGYGKAYIAWQHGAWTISS